MSRAYYNEFDPYAAAWLKNLIAEGLIAPGDVDTRSITDVRPSDLAGYTQCHFFAGIGGWSLAARLAGWPDERPLWTGSCPCQPFSVAGKQKGQEDERHLWPVMFELIRAERPPVFMGEQVAAAVGKDWLDGVCADLESIHYAVGATVVPACAVDAPHRRDRLWFVADASERRAGSVDRPSGERGRDALEGRGEGLRSGEWPLRANGPDAASSSDGSLADASCGRRGRPGEGEIQFARGAEAFGTGDRDVEHAKSRGRGEPGNVDRPQLASGGDQGEGRIGRSAVGSSARNGDVEHADGSRREYGKEGDAGRGLHGARAGDHQALSHSGRRNGTNWSGAEWAVGADGKARRVEPGIRLLAHGVPARVGKLRAFGNAIVPQVAAEVIAAYLDAERVRLTGVSGMTTNDDGVFA